MSSGYRSLLPQLFTHASQALASLLETSTPAYSGIRYLDVATFILVALAHMLLAVVVQIAQDNKVRVLALYSEVRVKDVRLSLLKCQIFARQIALRGHDMAYGRSALGQGDYT
jgi:hypothetical protein